MHRRIVLKSASAIATGLGLARVCPAAAQTPSLPSAVRVGYQKSSLLAVAKQQKLFETRFGEKLPFHWVEFAYGPPLLEALAAGRLDYGYTGNAPPVFAQAARASILYVAIGRAHV